MMLSVNSSAVHANPGGWFSEEKVCFGKCHQTNARGPILEMGCQKNIDLHINISFCSGSITYAIIPCVKRHWIGRILGN